MLVFQNVELVPKGYTDSNFQSYKDSHRSISSFAFTFGGVVVSWKSVKQSCITNSTIEVEYVVASKVAKEAIWHRKFLLEHRVIPLDVQPLILFCDNSGPVAWSKEPRNHQKVKHIERKYHLIHKIVQKGDVLVEKIPFANNLVDPLTKTFIGKVFDGHKDSIGVRCVPNMF